MPAAKSSEYIFPVEEVTTRGDIHTTREPYDNSQDFIVNSQTETFTLKARTLEGGHRPLTVASWHILLVRAKFRLCLVRELPYINMTSS